MEEKGGVKLTGIWQIVRLKELLQKWQSTTNCSKEDDSSCSLAGISPEVSERISDVHCVCDSDDDSSSHGPKPPADVPKGYLAVYVGPELRRFIVPTSYLSHHLFKVLLEKAEEEFGFEHHGGLTLPCEIETFKYLLKCMEKEDAPDNSLDEQDQSDDYHAESIEE